MTDGRGVKQITAGTITFVAASLGITPKGVAAVDTINGFVLGQDTDILVQNEQLSWYAHD